MPYQLISKNEYGETSIEASSENIDELVKLAYQKVTSDNIENALTLDDKINDWESCFVEILDTEGEPTNEAVYGGIDRGKHFVYVFEKNDVKKVYLDDKSLPMRFYIGTDNKKKLYASVPAVKRRGERDLITDLNHSGLIDKTFYYILKR